MIIFIKLIFISKHQINNKKIKINLAVLAIFSIVGNTLFAQNNSTKTSLEIKSGGVFLGSGDIWLLGNSLKINFRENKRIGFFIEPAYISGHSSRPSFFSTYNGNLTIERAKTIAKINLGANINLNTNRKYRLQLSPNVSFAKIRSMLLGNILYVPFEGLQEEFRYLYLPPKLNNDIGIGGGLIVMPNYQINNNLGIGLGLSTQLYQVGAIDHHFFGSFKIGL